MTLLQDGSRCLTPVTSRSSVTLHIKHLDYSLLYSSNNSVSDLSIWPAPRKNISQFISRAQVLPYSKVTPLYSKSKGLSFTQWWYLLVGKLKKEVSIKTQVIIRIVHLKWWSASCLELCGYIKNCSVRYLFSSSCQHIICFLHFWD